MFLIPKHSARKFLSLMRIRGEGLTLNADFFEKMTTEVFCEARSSGLFDLSSLMSGPFVLKTRTLLKVTSALTQVWNLWCAQIS